VCKQDDLVFLTGPLESGQIKPVIDASFPLRRTDEAMQYFVETHAKGKNVIIVEHGGGRE
jgi:NADPH:quinone reductase-like Zn-dependent oxidoreductase